MKTIVRKGSGLVVLATPVVFGRQGQIRIRRHSRANPRSPHRDHRQPRASRQGTRRRDRALVRRRRCGDAGLHPRRRQGGLRRGAHLLHPQYARPRAAQRSIVGIPDAAARPADPCRAHDGDAERHAGALHGAGASRRCRHKRRLCRAAMAEHPQRHPPDRRRAAPLRARLRRRLEARPRPAVRDLRRAHPRHIPVDAVEPDRLDGEPRRNGGAARIQPPHRHLDHLRRGLQPALFRRRRGALRSCRSQRTATACCRSTASRKPGR